jgi:regulator of ribonuclease activity A
MPWPSNDEEDQMGSLTADLMDENGAGLQSCETQFRQFGGAQTFQGTIRTVLCHDDTVLVKRVLAEPGHGQVLVIDGGGSFHSALMGDLTAAGAAERGWAGLVIFGAVRDADALGAVPLGIKALGTSPRKPQQQGVGEIDVDVSFGGVTFRPGNLLWSDADGVVTPVPGAPPEPAGAGAPR